MITPRLNLDLAILWTENVLHALDLHGQPPLQYLDVLLLIRVEVQGRFLRRNREDTWMAEMKCHLVGKDTTAVVWMVDDA